MRSGSSNGGSRSNTESTTLKIAVLTLMPSANVNTAVIVKARLRMSARTAKRRSFMSVPKLSRVMIEEAERPVPGLAHVLPVGPEGHDWVDGRRSPSGEPAPQRRDRDEYHHRDDERQRIRRAHVMQQGRE